MYDYRYQIYLFRESENYESMVKWIEDNSNPSEFEVIKSRKNVLEIESLSDYYISEAAQFCFNHIWEEDTYECIKITTTSIKNMKTRGGYQYDPLTAPVFLGILAYMCILEQGRSEHVAASILRFMQHKWPALYKSYLNAINKTAHVVKVSAPLVQPSGNIRAVDAANKRDFPYLAKGISPEGRKKVFRVLDSLSNATKAEVGAALQELMDDGLIDFNYESNRKIYPALQPFIKLKESTFITISLKKSKYVKNN